MELASPQDNTNEKLSGSTMIELEQSKISCQCGVATTFASNSLHKSIVLGISHLQMDLARGAEGCVGDVSYQARGKLNQKHATGTSYLLNVWFLITISPFDLRTLFFLFGMERFNSLMARMKGQSRFIL